MRPGDVLIASNEHDACGAIAQRFACVVVTTCASARKVSVDRTWGALILEESLPDGSGLDLLGELRLRGCTAPVVVISTTCDRATVNRAFDLQANVLCAPIAEEQLVLFLRHARERAAARPRLDAAIDTLVKVHGLTRCESELIAAALAGVPRRHFVESRGISTNTYKTHVRNALRKLGARALDEVRLAVARDGSPSHPERGDDD